MTRVAAIDCGTNSIRLLVADGVLKGDAIALNDLTRQMRIVRLGQGVESYGTTGSRGDRADTGRSA